MNINAFKIYIAGLNWTTDERQLRDTFSPFGTIVDLELIRDNYNNQSRGFGFITYKKSSEASASLVLDGHILDRRPITVELAIERTQEERRTILLEKKQAEQLSVAAYSGKTKMKREP